MLEQLRQQSRSFIIWIILGIIILVFIISFGPQANAELGCGATDSAALEVDGQEVGQQSWRYAINGLPRLLPDFVRGRGRAQRNNMAMDLLVAREILAQAGEDAGFRVSTELVNEKLKKGEWYFLGYRADKSWFFVEGYFSYDALERHAQNLGLTSVAQFIDQQRRELAADAYRSMIVGGVQVSREEVLASFNHENTLASIDYIRFRTPTYRRPFLDTAQIDAYLADNADEVKKKYEAEAVNYKETKPAVKLRQIFLAKAADAKPTPEPGDDDGNDATGGDGGDTSAPDPAKAKADELHASLTGGADFAELATANSDDKVSAPRGGLLGWRRLDRPGLADQKLVDAVATLEAGKLSPVIETDKGFYILKVDDKREGDLSFDQVKHEIAEEMAKQHFASKAAKADADAALAQIKAGAVFEDLFNKAPPRIDPNMLREQLNLPPGTNMEEVLEQYRKALEGAGGQTGSIIVHGPAIPAEWQGGPEAGDKPAATAKPVTAKPAKPKAPPKPKTAAGDGDGDDDAKTFDKFTSPDDGLPRPDKLTMPTIESQQMFNRQPKTVPGLGESEALVTTIFDELETGAIAQQVFEVSGDYVLVKLTMRNDPDLDDFTKHEDELLQRARAEKAQDTLGVWLKDRCTKLAEGGDIAVDKRLLETTDPDSNKTIPSTYQACSFF